MLCESLREFVAVADWCITTNKPKAPEGSVYGYPAADLLCDAIASIGSWVTAEPTTERQFAAALTDFFALDIDRSTAAEVYKRVRNRLSHNAILAKETVLMPGAPSAPPIVQKDGHVVVNLVALLERTRAAVEKLASSPATYILPDGGARAAFDAKPTQNREGWQYLSTFSAAASGCAPLDHL